MAVLVFGTVTAVLILVAAVAAFATLRWLIRKRDAQRVTW